ncbi:MAG: hypothetical protein WD231_04800 [Candidatus Woykebacteria bacterium]
MLTTPHLLVGAAIGSALPEAWQVVPVAAASHFVFDSIPHIQGYIEVEDLEKKEVLFLTADLLFGLGLLAVLALNSPVGELMWIGGIAAILPDFHHIIQVIFGPEALSRYHKLHMKFHWKKPMSVLPGVATQVITVLVAIVIAVRSN